MTRPLTIFPVAGGARVACIYNIISLIKVNHIHLKVPSVRDILINVSSSEKECVTCISGSIPFPNIAAIIEMEVKALKTREDFLGSKE